MGDESRQPDVARLDDTPLWDVGQVARYLNISVATVRAWVLNREIPFLKIGRLVRFVPADIVAWKEQRRVAQDDDENGNAA